MAAALAMAVSPLTQLPPEILHNILGLVDPDDLASLPLTCRSLYHFVTGNAPLCRAIYLRHLDEPPTGDVPWEQELHDLVALQRICAGRDANKKAEHLPFVHATLTRLLQRASHSSGAPPSSSPSPSSSSSSSRNAALLARLFEDEATREAFLCRSFLFERARGHVGRFADPPRPAHRLAAHLHCLYGAPVLRCGRAAARGRGGGPRLYPFACSKVYDLRQHTEATRWGPFAADGSGRVDWEKVEAVLLVLRSNMRDKGLDGFRLFANLWNAPFVGSWPHSYRPRPPLRERSELDERDPYGVAGTWLRVVCFLDYSDFISYNFPVADAIPDNVPRPALDVGEATRLILMKMYVTAIEPPGKDDGQALPVVHFRGSSRSLDGAWDETAHSNLRGTCRLTSEGEVRWTTWSIFGGQERWRSESVQVGGVRAARGVVGHWFDTNYDPQGPCGPTAFWKIGEGASGDAAAGGDSDANEDDRGSVGYLDFLPLLDGAGPGDDDDDNDDGDGDGEEGDDEEGDNEEGDDEEGDDESDDDGDGDYEPGGEGGGEEETMLLEHLLFPLGMDILDVVSDSE